MKNIFDTVKNWLKAENHYVELGWDEDQECCEILLVNTDGKILADNGQCYPPEVDDDEIQVLLKNHGIGKMGEM